VSCARRSPSCPHPHFAAAAAVSTPTPSLLLLALRTFVLVARTSQLLLFSLPRD
jgi:hypothetical protein